MAFATRITRTVRHPDGTTRKVRSKKFFACYRDPGKPGPNKWRRRAGYDDKRLTEQLARRLEREAIEVHEGLRSPHAGQRARPVADLAAEYRQALLDKGDGADHADDTHGMILRAAAGCGWRTAADLDADKAARWLAERRAAGAAGTRRRFGPATSNHYVTALRAFGKWLAPKRLPADPFATLAKVNAESDRRHVRRALGPDELPRLVAAASASPETHFGLAGPQRAALYTAAAYTGLRAEESSRVTPSHLRLDGDHPTVRLSGAEDKAGRGDTVPLHPAAVAAFREAAAGKAPGERLWPGDWWKFDGAELVRRDLAAAGIPHKDARGEVIDFHALRVTFVTNLARAGVPLQTAVKLARVTDARLIVNVYTKLGGGDLAGEVAKLPRLKRPKGRRRT